MVSTSPRVVPSTLWISRASGSATSLRPGVEQEVREVVGDVLRAEEAGQRRHHDQEGKQRQQRRERDVARQRPAVILAERV